MAAIIDDPKYDIFYNETADKDTSECVDSIFSPLEALDNKGNIRFNILASDKYWLDPSNGHIDFEARILKSDGTVPPTTAKTVGATTTPAETVAFVNNAAHSLFKDIKGSINETVIFGGDHNYHLNAYMYNHLQFNNASKATWKITEGYHSPTLDTSNKEFTDWEHESNKAIAKASGDGNWLRLTIPLRAIPIFNQDKALPPGKKVHLALTRNDPKFAIWAKDGSKEYDFEIRNMVIHIPRIRPSLTIQAQIAEKSRSHKASYYYPNLRLFRYNIARGSNDKELFNIFQGQPVKLAIFALVPSAYYNDATKRKFIYKRHNMREIELRSEGRAISGKPLNTSDVMEAYRHFSRQLGLYRGNDDIGINLDDFDKYSNIWPFDCTLGGNVAVRQDSADNRREYNLILKFKTPTTQSLDVLCHFVMDERFILGPGNEVISADYAK